MPRYVNYSMPSLRFTNGVTDISIPFDYKDAWMLKASCEYKLNGKLALRGGYMYTQNDVPDITLNPGNPAYRPDNRGRRQSFAAAMKPFSRACTQSFCNIGDF